MSRFVAIVALFVATTVAGNPGNDVLDVGSNKQLFLGPWTEDGRDAHLIESMTNVTMTMNSAEVTGERLMELDRPWEGDWTIDPLRTVIKDGNLFRMYYGAAPGYRDAGKIPNYRIICYAESEDGISWVKPNLRLCEWNGSRDNNIIIPNDEFEYVMSEFAGPGVFIDHNAKSPKEKYKLLSKLSPVGGKGQAAHGPSLPKGQYLFSSPDGLRWRLMRPRRVNPGASDAKFTMFWDEPAGEYVMFTRVKHIHDRNHPKLAEFTKFYQQQYGLDPVGWGRMIGRTTSKDLQDWGPEDVVLASDTLDHSGFGEDYIVEDREDGGKYRGVVDIYDGEISKYSEASNAYIAMPGMYYHWREGTFEGPDGSYKSEFPDTMDVQLATSRDGLHWNRAPGRKPFIALGPRETSWWSKQIRPAGNAIRVGDELWFYFTAYDVSHALEHKVVKNTGSVGRAILRLDGFISANAAYAGGEVITKPIVFSGDCLQLNIDTGARGIARVEILDIQGEPISGFTLNDADEINGNHIRVFASWNEDTDLSEIAGKPVRLRFVMRASKLYSFQFLSNQTP